MNEGQKKFSEFIMARVDAERKEEVQTLLNESFAKQADGTFNAEYLQEFIPRMGLLIREDAKEEVLEVMKNFQKK